MFPQPNLPANAQRGVPTPFARRNDLETAKIVNQGIKLQERIGTDYAAAYLSHKGVRLDIAMRVLSRPWERRRY